MEFIYTKKSLYSKKNHGRKSLSSICLIDTCIDRGGVCSGLESGQGCAYAGLGLCMVESGSACSGVEICLIKHNKACHSLSKAVHHVMNYPCAQWVTKSLLKGLSISQPAGGRQSPLQGH